MKSKRTQNSLVLFDPHPVVLRGLRAMVLEHGRYMVVGETTSAHTLVELVAREQPSILIADVNVADEAGLQLIRELQGAAGQVRIVLFLAWNNGCVVMNALRNLVAGLLFKECPPAEILSCLEVVASGRHYFTPLASDSLVSQFARTHPGNDHAPRMDKLTAMERRILAQVASDKTSAQIAAALFISPHTVSTHRKNIAAKLKLRGKHGLLKYAMHHREDLLGWAQEFGWLPSKPAAASVAWPKVVKSRVNG